MEKLKEFVVTYRMGAMREGVKCILAYDEKEAADYVDKYYGKVLNVLEKFTDGESPNETQTNTKSS